MLYEYYVVYSVQTSKGTGLGRTSVTCELPIDSFERVKQVEQSVSVDLRAKGETVINLFLTFWRQIKQAA
jgi:hypothetical protein